MAELFSSNCDIRKNAYLNWRTRQGDPAYNLHIMASNFADSALTLINAVLQDNTDKKADTLIMPILYSIDQAIELYMKTIIRLIEDKEGGLASNYTSELYEKISTKDAKGRKVVNIDFARYPFDTDGKAHFYVEDTDNVVIDVENLGQRFSSIRDTLESLCLMYENK